MAAVDDADPSFTTSSQRLRFPNERLFSSFFRSSLRVLQLGQIAHVLRLGRFGKPQRRIAVDALGRSQVWREHKLPV